LTPYDVIYVETEMLYGACSLVFECK